MSGDGLTDLVRIRNGEVCYWPNLGYGRFGAKVTMDDAPWFDASRPVRPAAHPPGRHRRLRHHRPHLPRPRRRATSTSTSPATRWGQPQSLSRLPRVDNLRVGHWPLDLLGNGTACLVWSSPLPGDARRPMRYIDLMGGQKPHLLVHDQEQPGRRDAVEYAPSTQFYLADKLAGTPWVTRLPFPVHVVERVETYDRISRNRFVTRYAYHHGYFDGVEREFRGFGMVEQWDTEEFAALAASDAVPPPTTSTRPRTFPRLTRTWFHTGAFLERAASRASSRTSTTAKAIRAGARPG